MIDSVTHKASAVLKAPSDAAVGSAKLAQDQGKSNIEKVAEQSAPPLNPRLRYDSSSGIVVTEFLDHSGSVQTQAPSNAVLAYLRVGLNKDGRSAAVEKLEQENSDSNRLDA